MQALNLGMASMVYSLPIPGLPLRELRVVARHKMVANYTKREYMLLLMRTLMTIIVTLQEALLPGLVDVSNVRS